MDDSSAEVYLALAEELLATVSAQAYEGFLKSVWEKLLKGQEITSHEAAVLEEIAECL